MEENLPTYEDVAVEPEVSETPDAPSDEVGEGEDYTEILAPIPPEDILLFLKDQGLIAADVELIPLEDKMTMEEGGAMGPPPFEAMMSEGETDV